ncbi:MAG: ABC transporter permease [Elusimicrobia bacterium]|nr:ABC transporter permease [Elusimicrobiota bacterium]
MAAGESLRTGFIEIRAHKLRSFLSFFAIAFGVAAILYTFANLNLMYDRRDRGFRLSGTGRITVSRSETPGGPAEGARSKGLTSADAAAIRRALPWAYLVGPKTYTQVQFVDGPFQVEAGVAGVSLDWPKRGWVFTQRGRFFNAHDMETAAKVCIVMEPGAWSGPKPDWWARRSGRDFNAHIARSDPLGRVIQLGGGLYTVVGVLKDPPKDKDPRWSHMGHGNILVPLSTAQRYLSPMEPGRALDAVDQIVVETGSLETIPRALRRIEELLAERHRGVADYEVSDFQQTILSMMAHFRQEAVAFLAVALVAMLAGGVGIMNVTLATVFSRYREIGIRRALGATRGDILLQFLAEAALLGVIGGIFGALMGTAGVRYLSEDGLEAARALCWWHFPAILGLAAGIAVVFAAVPAYRASRLHPVQALRFE